MIKAVSITVGLILLAAAPTPLRAQQNAAQVAEEEAVRRAEAQEMLHRKLGVAQAMQRSGRTLEAAKAYEDAYTLFPRTGDGATIDADKQAVATGLVQVRVQLAEQARKEGDLKGADEQIKRGLKVDAQYPALVDLKMVNDRELTESLGKRPSDEVVAEVPKLVKGKQDAGTLAQDGRVLYEMGALDRAEEKLLESLAADPENKTAKYYLTLVKEQRFLRGNQKRTSNSKDSITDVTDAWTPPETGKKLPFPNPLQRTNFIHTSPQRQEIVAKLNTIRVPEISYDSLPLVEVLKQLKDEAKKRDPEGLGMNFMIGHTETPPSSIIPADPTAPLLAEPLPPTDISTANIKISPSLNNLRLIDVLDVIVSVSDQPIRYELRDYTVVFTARPQEPVQLETRTYRVDPNTFIQGLESVSLLSIADNIGSSSGGGSSGGGGGQSSEGQFTIPRVELAPIRGGRGSGGGGGNVGGIGGYGITGVTRTNQMGNLNEVVRAYFAAAGVELNPPKNIFFNDRKGILMVRATLQDLEIIEKAIEVLNEPPPQIRVKSRIAEISQTDSKALGFDWFLGNMTMGGGKVGATTGSAPSYNGTPTAANPSGVFPGPGYFPGVPGPGAIAPSVNDNRLTSGLRNRVGDDTIPDLGTVTGILTDPQFRFVIKALEQRSGVDTLAAPEVTTLSGRQAQMAVIDLRVIATGVEEGQSNNTQPSTGGNGNNIVNQLPSFIPNTQAFPFGPSLDVIPYVCADGFTIQMTLFPSVTEFVGYDDPGAFVPVSATTSGTPITAVLPLPHIRVRQVTTSCIVYDGQTVVLGGLISESIRKIKDKVPMLGDVPWVGRLFRSESNSTEKRNLLIFVTPTIIDPAGNRVHHDDDLPFAKNSFPSQTEAK